MTTSWALELIRLLVEVLGGFFGNLCELDLAFHFDKVYHILDELLFAGEISDTSPQTSISTMNTVDKLDLESRRHSSDRRSAPCTSRRRHCEARQAADGVVRAAGTAMERRAPESLRLPPPPPKQTKNQAAPHRRRGQ